MFKQKHELEFNNPIVHAKTIAKLDKHISRQLGRDNRTEW